MVRVFALIVVGLAACDGVRSLARLYFLLRVIVVCGAAVAVFGILQYLFGFDLTPYMRVPGMHFWSMTDSVGSPQRPDPRCRNDVEPARVRRLLRHGPAPGHPCRIPRPAERSPGPASGGRASGSSAVGLMFSVSRSAIIGVTAAAFVLFLGWSARRRMWMAGRRRVGLHRGDQDRRRRDSSTPSAACSRTRPGQQRPVAHSTTTRRPSSSSRSTSGWAEGRARGTRPSTRSSTTSTS